MHCLIHIWKQEGKVQVIFQGNTTDIDTQGPLIKSVSACAEMLKLWQEMNERRDCHPETHFLNIHTSSHANATFLYIQ